MAKSKIEWTDEVWNPLTGCTKVSQGCKHCYAETIAERFWATQYPPNEDGSPRKFTDVRLHPERLEDPLKWRKPRRVFVNSMSDLFHPSIPFEFIADVFDVMADDRCEHHTFQILTKRPERIKSFLYWAGDLLPGDTPMNVNLEVLGHFGYNVWLGVSVEDQSTADARIPLLLQTPAAVRFVSYEPALGPVDFSEWLLPEETHPSHGILTGDPQLDWIIMGGESGPGARPMHPDWVRSVRDQCQAAGVPFFFKQWGEWAPGSVVDNPRFSGGRAYTVPGQGTSAAIIATPPPGAFQSRGIRPMVPGDETHGGVRMLDRDTVVSHVGKRAAGRLLDGRTWDEFPEAM